MTKEPSMQNGQAPGNIRKKFCKFCWDRGLPTTTCFSHYVKDRKGPGGVIICPTLLKEQCMRCGMIGHTPRYCTSTKPVLTQDNPTGDRTKCTCCLRMIHCENWIEPIPTHLRAVHTEWIVSRALERRRVEMLTSRHGLGLEYDEDAKMEMIIFSGRLVEGRANKPYSDYELEVLAKCDVTRDLLRAYCPKGYAKLTNSGRAILQSIVRCNDIKFYSLPPASSDANDGATMNAFHAYDLPPTPTPTPTPTPNTRSIAAIAANVLRRIYKSRVLRILNDSAHRRRSYCK